MASFSDSLQQLVNKDYDELLYLAKKSLAAIWDECKKVDEKNNGALMLTCIILSAIAADGKLSALERKFLGDLIGLNDEQINGYIKAYDSKMASVTDGFVDNLSDDHKADALILISAIAACDETITREENAFLHKILE